jgi:hypothetical protein
MNENKDVRCTRVGEVIRTAGATSATLLALIVAVLLFGCAKTPAARERSDSIAGSGAAKITAEDRRKVFAN